MAKRKWNRILELFRLSSASPIEPVPVSPLRASIRARAAREELGLIVRAQAEWDRLYGKA